ncbi:MAG: hypothetical protein JXA14_05865 [Anaerolineae bacterium]|nr:hypothetical protein [Anaerolineae bacterium]
MDKVLENALRFGYMVRNTSAAESWRQAWQILAEINMSGASIAQAPINEIPVTDFLHGMRMDAPGTRPLLFLLLLPSRICSPQRVRSELKPQSIPRQAYEQLTRCLGFAGVLTEFLRSTAPGYPHDRLIHTLDNTPWRQLTSAQEVPWGIGKSLIPDGARDALSIALSRFVGEAAPQVATSLNSLASAMTTHEVWSSLERAWRDIERRGNILHEMERIREAFDQKWAAVPKPPRPTSNQRLKAVALATDLYARRGRRIRSYVTAFEAFENLVERVYWIVTQLVIHESISCITSGTERQLQQVNVEASEGAILTGVAPTIARTLEPGQLVHVTLPQMNHLLDGLYQVEQTSYEYEAGIGDRMLFRARRQWLLELSEGRDALDDLFEKILVPSEETTPLDGLVISIDTRDGKKEFTVREEVPFLTTTKVMHVA